MWRRRSKACSTPTTPGSRWVWHPVSGRSRSSPTTCSPSVSVARSGSRGVNIARAGMSPAPSCSSSPRSSRRCSSRTRCSGSARSRRSPCSRSGVVCFLWSYLHAVQRSRTNEISVTGLYFLAGPPTPVAVKRPMLALLAVQVITATATTFARLDGPDGKPGSSLAVGFLVPMFGFGLNGLWAAFHGTFQRRQRPISSERANRGRRDRPE